MKNRPLFQQDVGMFLQSNLVRREDYVLSYSKSMTAFYALSQAAKDRQFPFLEAPFWMQEKIPNPEFVEKFQKFRMILIIGSTEDVSAAKALTALLQSWVWIEDTLPRLCILDHLDPENFWEMMSIANPNNTGIVVLSHSGENASVNLQLMRCLEYWQGLIPMQDFPNHFLIVTQKGETTLKKIGMQFSLSFLMNDSLSLGGLGCFSQGTLLIGGMLGIDTRKFCKGAALTCNQFFTGQLMCPVEIVALILSIHTTIDTHCFIPFGGIFFSFIQWYQTMWQKMWGENFRHFIPISALPFSQVPVVHEATSFFTLLIEKQMARERLMPELWERLPEVKNLARTALADFAQMEAFEIQDYLTKKRLPFRILRVQTVNEETLGALFMNSLLESALLHMAVKT